MNGEFCLDANIFITAWYDLYPPRILKSLWAEIAKHQKNMILIKPIFDEIEPISSANSKLSKDKKNKAYPLRSWLSENNFIETAIDDQTREISLELEKEYEISDTSKGASQNDITLIAYTKIKDKTVVTFEADQQEPPGKKSNYKIPLICTEQNVKCIKFIKMLECLGIET